MLGINPKRPGDCASAFETLIHKAFQVLMLPCLLQRFSTTRLLRGSTLLLVPIVLLMPNVSLAPVALRWPLFVVLISSSKALAGAFFTCSFMLINNSVPVSTIRPVRGVLCRPPIPLALLTLSRHRLLSPHPR